MKNVPKNLKRGTFWDFLTSMLLQNVKNRGGQLKNFRKKSNKAEKGGKSRSGEHVDD